MVSVKSRNGIVIRLTDERWEHIKTGHEELIDYKNNILDTVTEPEAIFEGKAGEYLAVNKFDERRKLVVVYSEFMENNGFVITAYVTSKIEKIEKLKKVWPL